MGDRAVRPVERHQARGVARLYRRLGDQMLRQVIIEIGEIHEERGERWEMRSERSALEETGEEVEQNCQPDADQDRGCQREIKRKALPLRSEERRVGKEC